ncbi:SMI1/KNR4 family protein [Longispora sp. NPDC051575]|uniref:SMI1/KNR4 family protein n=1 Tax=Longispora sp. NPDC051575 TaxID=3154943 RepID=UPI0034324D82
MPHLHSIDQWLTAHAPITATSLRPPATVEQLDRAERELGHPLPDELRQLYLWHDGTVGLAGSSAPFDIEPSLYFQPLDEALAARQWLNDLYATINQDDYITWRAHWLPIAADDCGAYVVVETQGPHTGRVIYRSDEDGPHLERAWPTLTHWADALSTALTTGEPFMRVHLPVPVDGTLTWDWVGPSAPTPPSFPPGFQLPQT